MPARFVILHHVLPDGEHWDLMLECDGVLLSWRIPIQGPGALSTPIAAQRMADHRLAYLDYEGPVSGNRGSVARVDRGGLEISFLEPHRIEFTASGSRMRGSFRLSQIAGGDWVLQELADP